MIRLLVIPLVLAALACTSVPTPTPSPTPSRCEPAPDALTRQLSMGLTAGGESSISNVYTVMNNDGRPWRFIAGRVKAPGLNQTMVWATGSLDLDGTSLIVATDSLSAEFSIWSLPGGQRFASQFDDEIREVERCAAS